MDEPEACRSPSRAGPGTLRKKAASGPQRIQARTNPEDPLDSSRPMILRSGKVTVLSPQPLGDPNVLEEDRWPSVRPCWQLQKSREASRPLERNWGYEVNTQEASGEVHVPNLGQCQALAQESSNKEKWAKAFEEAPQVSWSQPIIPTLYFSALPEDETFPCPLSLTPCPLYRRRLWPRKLNIPPKTRSIPDSTLVLELDEILVSCSLRTLPNAHFSFPVRFQGIYYKVQGRLRPHAREFLEFLSQFFQDDCICLQGHYVKDLRVLGQDLARTVVLTDSFKAFPYQMDNQLLIPQWQGDSEDQELPKLLPFLQRLSRLDDVRPELWSLYPSHRVTQTTSS
ncbi:CTD small phosphatase-like protein 2-A isoform X2 [Antechinus flavipes]|uniref:CTD small phosphatase-like protein 2-A isoform X2 n=1 Tax=Antechinus flavipes TaxID=38775 RepID=UPI002235D79A|nr:CTD small phosphatase-like protein 2-A isoform X2 [Antechinus flavipes]